LEDRVGRFPWGYVLIAFGLGILASSIFLYVTTTQSAAPSVKTGSLQRSALRAP
jgi:hypothetical protein